MSKWKHRQEGKKISAAVIRDKSTRELKLASAFIRDLLDLKKSQKLTKTYIKGTEAALEYNGVDKVFVDFRFEGTATGRLSCASYNAQKKKGVSFHTLPRPDEDSDDELASNIRSLYVAPKGWDFITADYATMELRILAQIADEKAMLKAFREGADLHTYTAQLVFEKQDISKFERQLAKAVSFLIVYGGGAFNLAETMRIPMSRAEEVIRAYQRVYPRVFTYMDKVNSFTKSRGYAESIFGRRRHLPNVNSRDKKLVARALRQGLNFTIQSPASDVLLCAVLGISTTFKERQMESRLVATVHDSIEAVSPPWETDEACRIIKNEMENYPTLRERMGMEFVVPLVADIEVGDSFGTGKKVEL